MTLDLATVLKIAHLAHLKIPPEHQDSVAGDLNKILNWVSQLDEVDVTGIEPLANVNDGSLGCREEDVVTDGNQPEAVLANAPSKTADFFTVPKVVE